MYHLVEQPIRTGGVVSTRTARIAVPSLAVVLLLGSFSLTRDLPDPPDFLQTREPGDLTIREVPTTTTTTTTTTVPDAADPLPPPVTEPPPTAPPRRPRRVLLVGDSVAASIEDALGDTLQRSRHHRSPRPPAPGCGVLTGDPADAQGQPLSFTTACNDAVPGIQTNAVGKVGPDLVVSLSLWESVDRIVDGSFYQVGTPAGRPDDAPAVRPDDPATDQRRRSGRVRDHAGQRRRPQPAGRRRGEPSRSRSSTAC